MIDRTARDIAATALRKFLEGAITNYTFEDSYPSSKSDPAIASIASSVWFYYSDLEEHKLVGRRALKPQALALCQRCLLFLEGDFEFAWPPPVFGVRYLLLRCLGLGHWIDRRDTADMAIGDIEVWPFLRRDDYEVAKLQSGLRRRP